MWMVAQDEDAEALALDGPGRCGGPVDDEEGIDVFSTVHLESFSLFTSTFNNIPIVNTHQTLSFTSIVFSSFANGNATDTHLSIHAASTTGTFHSLEIPTAPQPPITINEFRAVL